MYDVQISSRYNNVYEKENLPDDDYDIVTDFLTEQGIEVAYDCTFPLYLLREDDFHNRVKYDFPVAAISLSDYNAIRDMLGLKPISLKENEFTTQWQSIATNENARKLENIFASMYPENTDTGVSYAIRLSTLQTFHFVINSRMILAKKTGRGGYLLAAVSRLFSFD